ncbi:5-(carboxyamino)imidazole ribonucleotide synthase [Lihuaxuella thermophila]|uniref:N5-carboxyaminoimidazole ribonucleotide synthase n=1 Tax=Lihuaxuella thermophila TaxID=1173111 RepID=A0A1H8J1P1_9BACL|nr:5-(carboxyamino)imidazole ribonucleotide synthase [Lihuaxuella thermophila]SEN74117.1 5-(carboxyamino)imidazole ribonucleotide synthase [Lihuaxuella thermophila]
MKHQNLKQTKMLPGQTIGILGGGQLGRMIILEGRKMGYRFITLDPARDCPGSQVADEHIVGAYDDLAAAQRLAERSDLIVYEFENLSPDVVRQLEQSHCVPQGSRLLEITRHRLEEKRAVEQAGVPVAPYRVIETREDLTSALQELGYPAVLKTTTGGYDGKGQWRIQTPEEVASLPVGMFNGERQYILEKFIPFVKEMSVVVARSVTGEVAAFPPAVNLHRRHILHMSITPAPVSAEIMREAERMAVRVAEHLQVVGLVAVEMFVLPDGGLLVNELAPRPHNSGHYTYDACHTSQFEQFLRAVTGLPLGSPAAYSPAVMVNILGEHAERLMNQFHRLPKEMKVHWYGKKEAKTGRKMGHVTVLADTVEQALQIIESVDIWPPLTDKEKDAIQNEMKQLQEVRSS